MPDTVSSVEQRCIDSGMKMTEQRRVIARVLSEADDHPDVEELHRRAAEQDPRISIATVYRTVRLMEEAGILESHHDHLIDIKSGKVIEFQNDAIEKLQEQIAQQHGYKLVSHRLELYAVPLKKDET